MSNAESWRRVHGQSVRRRKRVRTHHDNLQPAPSGPRGRPLEEPYPSRNPVRAAVGDADRRRRVLDRPAELFRVYPPKSVASDPEADRSAGQNAIALASINSTEMLVRQAQLEAAVRGLQAILEAERKRGEELRTERDRWATQAERLALPAPQNRRGFTGWLKRA